MPCSINPLSAWKVCGFFEKHPLDGSCRKCGHGPQCHDGNLGAK